MAGGVYKISKMMKKTIRYMTEGVCSEYIDITVEDEIVREVCFEGGCNGNLQGISSLVRGMKVDDAIARLEGIHCGYKGTSCPDQFARALKELKSES